MTVPQPKVSLITVAYNAEASIADTLRSVAAQTYPDIEYIVIDGASTDRTLAIIRESGAPIQTLISEPDRGIYDAMNKGLARATGDIIGFLNADDAYADSGVIARVVTAMEGGSLDAVFADVEFVNPAEPGRPLRRYRSDRFSPGRLAWGWMPAHPTLFFRRQVYERFGHFRTDYRIAGDYELIVRVFSGGTLRYHHLPEVLVRMRTGGISTGGSRNTWLLNREVLRACRENGVYSNMAMILSKYPLKLLEFLRR